MPPHMNPLSNAPSNPNWSPLIEITRGKVNDRACVEIEHLGAIAVVSGEGDLLFSVGNAEQMVHLRSTAKPFQLLPFLLEGLHQKSWGDDQSIEAADLALLMASHSGEPKHIQRLERLLALSAISADALQCGVHAPYHDHSRRELIANGHSPNVLHNNCSGKHLAMLMVCKERGWPLDTYLEASHPLQKWIVDLVLSLSGASKDDLGIGVDGCSLPTFILPLSAIARLYVQLAYPTDKTCDNALSTLFAAGVAHPDMIAGSKRLEVALTEALSPALFAKTGADGVFAMAISPSDKYPSGLGIVVKVADGDHGQQARPSVVVEVLRQLDLLPAHDDQLSPELTRFASSTIKNMRGVDVASRRPVFRLAVAR
jgi:L-asparaginase II